MHPIEPAPEDAAQSPDAHIAEHIDAEARVPQPSTLPNTSPHTLPNFQPQPLHTDTLMMRRGAGEGPPMLDDVVRVWVVNVLCITQETSSRHCQLVVSPEHCDIPMVMEKLGMLAAFWERNSCVTVVATTARSEAIFFWGGILVFTNLFVFCSIE